MQLHKKKDAKCSAKEMASNEGGKYLLGGDCKNQFDNPRDRAVLREYRPYRYCRSFQYGSSATRSVQGRPRTETKAAWSHETRIA